MKNSKMNTNHTEMNETLNTENFATSSVPEKTSEPDAAEFSVAIEENLSESDHSHSSYIPPKGNDDLNTAPVLPPKKSAGLKFKIFLRAAVNLISILVFAGSLVYLIQIGFSYLQSKFTYENIENEVVSKPTKPAVPTSVPDTPGNPEVTQTPAPTLSAEEQLVADICSEYSYEPFVVDFNALQSKGKDVVSWIDIPGCDISYPMVLGEDNDYYLRHTYNGLYNVSGAIFYDYKMKADPDDQLCTLIYGHNQDNGKMFSSLHLYEDETTALTKQNQLVVIYTPDKINYYKVFSVRIVPSTDSTYAVMFTSIDQYQTYIDTAISTSIYDYETEVTTDQNILTLVTCTDDSNYRFVVHAVKLN